MAASGYRFQAEIEQSFNQKLFWTCRVWTGERVWTLDQNCKSRGLIGYVVFNKNM